jgi:small subunit ribosomal protein S1
VHILDYNALDQITFLREEFGVTEELSIADLQPKMRLQGVVKDTQLYGAVVDIGLEYDGVVHISQLAPRRVNRVADVVQPGDAVTVWVTKVNSEKGRIGLTMVEPPQVDWSELEEGQIYTGTVTRLERYGAFVDVGAERAGLLHVREMSTGYVRDPSELVKVGDEVEVRILNLDRRRRRIDLTMMGIADEIEDEPEEEPSMTAMEIALHRAQVERRGHGRRHGKRRSPDLSERAEREDILARTLKQHSKR